MREQVLDASDKVYRLEQSLLAICLLVDASDRFRKIPGLFELLNTIHEEAKDANAALERVVL